MPGHAKDAAHHASSFREAIANWRLALHTEVKRASSLPTAMFDACDPMLETRLAETTEAMLAHLHRPAPHDAEAPDDESAEQRLETVAADELRALPRLLPFDPHAPDLLTGLGAEYLAVLADACCVATGRPQRAAVEMLCRDFAVRSDADTAQLRQLIDDQIDEVAGVVRPGDAELELICRRIAAALTLHAPPMEPRGEA